MSTSSKIVAVAALCIAVPSMVVAQPSLSNCVRDALGSPACSHRNPPDNDDCPDTIVTNSDCKYTFPDTSGFKNSTPGTQICEYRESVPASGGGCTSASSTVTTWVASCPEATGEACGSAGSM